MPHNVRGVVLAGHLLGSVLMVFSSNIKSLEQGDIGTSKDKVQAQYNILLVGETGTGKSSLLEFIVNVLIGKSVDCYDFNILDRSNEQGGSGSESQTNSARVYDITTRNGILVSGSTCQ